MQANYYVPGQWNVICDECGFEFKSGEVRKRWDGLMVCKDDYEVDHPQKHIRVRETGMSVPNARPEPEDQFLEMCYLYAISAYAGLAEAGCMQAGIQAYPYIFLYNLKNASLG